MRLLNPSPGEILDRLSILELKITAATKRSVSSTHFEAEKASLEEVLKTWEQGIAEDCMGDGDRLTETLVQIAGHRNGLAACNALLWQAEDDVRALPAEAAFKLASLCKRIVSWNDGRAAHVRELNKLYGMEDEPEKIFATVAK